MRLPKIFFFFIILASLFLLLTPPIHAECAAEGQFAQLCNIDVSDNMTLIRTVIQALFVIAGVAALFFLIYGGVKWIMSGGDKAKISEARGMLTAAIVGLIITFLSFFVISLVNSLFGVKGGSIFVIPRLTNEKPLPPTNVKDVPPPCDRPGPC